MGIVFKQSLKNTIVIYLGFLIGGLNTIIFYPNILGKEFYGIVAGLLSYSNLIMPLMALGVHYTVIKFFSTFKTKEEKDKFLTLVILAPLVVAVPIGFLWHNIHHLIVTKFITEANAKISNYTIVIYIISLCCAYFEVFYAWSKVHLKTVLGNFLKEFYNRAVIMLLLFAVYFKLLDASGFIYVLTIMYVIRTLIMMGYAFKTYTPKLSVKAPNNIKEIIRFSSFIILAGSAGAIILDIDKVMVLGKETFDKAAYYTVAVFIGSFIEAPSRAMSQILQPLTSKSINDNDSKEIESLYKKSSINLLLIGGLFFLLVNCNVSELFRIMPKGYESGVLAVLLISLVKLFNMTLGNNGSIIANSKFYKITLPIGLGTAILVYILNVLFYHKINMNTNGLALATLVTIIVFNSFKLWFVKRKFSLSPFSHKTWQMLLIISVLFGCFYFWNFNVGELMLFNFPIHPIINIVLKSILIVSIYMTLIISLKISPQVNLIINKVLKK